MYTFEKTGKFNRDHRAEVDSGRAEHHDRTAGWSACLSIRQQAGAYSPPTERSTEEISVTEGVGTETDTGAVTVPVAHAAGQSATDAPTAADPPPTSEPDTETDPETATGQTGIWQTEIRVSVGLTFCG